MHTGRETPYSFYVLPGRIFVSENGRYSERAGYINDDARTVALAGVLTPPAMVMAVDVFRRQLAEERVTEPVIVSSDYKRRQPPPGWVWVSGCFLCKLASV